jgi:autotransporter-associated beta strand protein
MMRSDPVRGRPVDSSQRSPFARHLRLRFASLTALSAGALIISMSSGAATTVDVTDQAGFDAATQQAITTGQPDTINVLAPSPISADGLVLPGEASPLNLNFGLAPTLGVGNGSVGSLTIGAGTNLNFTPTTGVAIFRVGYGPGSSGTVLMTGGTITGNAAPNYLSLSVGRDFAAGTVNQSGGVFDLVGGAFQIGVESGQGAYNLSGNGVVNMGAGGTVYLGDSSGGSLGTGSLNVSDSATFTSGTQMYVGNDGGVGAITQVGPGSQVVLNGGNYFGTNASGGVAGTGTYNLVNGNLEIANGATAIFGNLAGGSGFLNQSGGTLSVGTGVFYIGESGAGQYNLSGGAASLAAGLAIAEFAGSTGVINQSGGVLSLPGGQIHFGAGTGAYNLDGGVLQIGGTNPITTGAGAYQFNLGGGTIQVLGSNLVSGINFGLVGGAASTIDTNGLGATLSGVLSGGGALTKDGAGTLLLSGVNTYTGATLVSAGTLQAGAAGAFAPASAFTVASGATLDLNGFSQTIGSLAGGGVVNVGAENLAAGGDNSSTAFSGTITTTAGVGAFIKLGAGTLTIDNATLGDTYVAEGAMAQTSGVTAVNYLAVGEGTSNVGALSVTGGTLSIGTGLQVGDFGGQGTVTQTAGTVQLGSSVNIGNQGGSGIYSISGGELDLSALLNTIGRNTGGNPGSAGELDISGGGVVDVDGVGGNAARLIIGYGGSTLAQSHGTITQTGGILRIDNNSTFNLSGLNTSAGVYNLEGGTLEIGGASLLAGYGGGAPHYQFNLGGGTIQVSEAALTTSVNATLTSGSASTIDTNGLGATLSGVLSGGGALAKAGAGTLVLSGVNTYTGGTTIAGGLVQATNNSSVGTGVVALNGGGFQAGASGLAFGNGFMLDAGATNIIDTQAFSLNLSGALSGAGGFTKQGSGILTLSGSSAYAGATNVNAGTLQGGAANAFAPFSAFTVASGAMLDLGGFNQAIGSLAGAGVIENSGAGPAVLTEGGNNASTMFSGVIQDDGPTGLTKIGSGTLTLTGANTYSGGTNIDAGTLAVANNSALGLGAVTLGGGVLQSGAPGLSLANAFAIDTTGGVIDAQANALTLSGPIGNGDGATGVLTKIGSGTLTLAGANTYSGGTNIDAGTLAVANNAALGLGAVTFGGGVLQSGAPGLSLANAFAIDTTGGVIDTQANTLTLLGPIGNGNGGTGALTKIGAGALVLSGVSSYSGATNVNAGTLQGGAANAFAPSSAFTVASGATLDLGGFNQAIGSLAGAGVIENSGAGPAVLTEGGNNASTIFSGVIQDDGPTGLTKIGSGTLTLSGSNSYTGPTDVNSGILDVEGSIASSSLTTVSGGATLTGGGAIGATRINSGGVFAPGSGAPGSSTNVFGGLTFDPGATYLVRINPTASFASVKGTASLAGNVLADFASGANLARQYTLLTTTGGLGGTTFAGLASAGLPAGFAETLTYDPDNVYLDLVASLGAQGGLNINQQNVATALNAAFNSGASLPPSFVNLYGLTGGALGTALTPLTGEAATGARQGNFLFTDMFLSLLVDPYGDNHGGEPGRAGSLSAARGCGGGDGGQPLAADSAKWPQASPCASRWNIWGAGFGGGEQTSGDSVIGSHNAQTGAGGVAAGADYHFSPDAMLGFALAGGTTNWSLSGALGGGNSNVFQGALYGAYQFGPAYLAGALTLGDYWLTTDRSVALLGGGTYRASFNSTEFGGRIESGYHVVLPLVTLTPYAAVQPQTFHAPSYVESASTFGSNFALNYNSQSATDTRFELGAWVDKSLVLPGNNGVVKLFGRLAWAYDWQSNPALTATFQNVPTASFAVNGAKPASNQALITAGVEWRLAQNWSLTAKFEDEFGAGSETYAATGRINYTW